MKKIITLIFVLLVAFFGFVPGKNLPLWYGRLIRYWWFDFLIHAGVFAGLTVLLFWTFHLRSKMLFFWAFTSSLLLEIGQYCFTEGRFISVKDMIGNLLGILIALGFITLVKRWLSLERRVIELENHLGTTKK